MFECWRALPRTRKPGTPATHGFLRHWNAHVRLARSLPTRTGLETFQRISAGHRSNLVSSAAFPKPNRAVRSAAARISAGLGKSSLRGGDPRADSFASQRSSGFRPSRSRCAAVAWLGRNSHQLHVIGGGPGQRGFAVFGVDHPYMGRIALASGQVTAAREDQFHSPAEIMDYYGRDLQFVIDRIAKLESKDPILTHSLDLSRLAAIGHSSGFSAVSNACSRDPRIKACVNIDAHGFTAALLKGLTQPLLWIRLQRAAPLPPEFLSARTSAVYDLQINGAVHDSVEDWNYLEASSSQERDRATKLIGVLRSYIAAFLQKSLPGRSEE